MTHTKLKLLAAALNTTPGRIIDAMTDRLWEEKKNTVVEQAQETKLQKEYGSIISRLIHNEFEE